ncbi:MAG: secD, partial [Cellvibrio sp.]|nr:secD [Cellvibrio sp.]
MLNRYPLWKYLLLLCFAVIGVIYSIPNLYAPDPAIQVSGDSSAKVIDAPVLAKMEAALKAANIEAFGGEVTAKTAMLRIKDVEQQMIARKLVQQALGDGYVVALNTAPTTPAWLQSLGAEPLKLGLDLAGGVHFLLEVDTASAVAKRQEINADDMKDKMRKAKVRYASVVAQKDNQIIARFRTAEARDEGL